MVGNTIQKKGNPTRRDKIYSVNQENDSEVEITKKDDGFRYITVPLNSMTVERKQDEFTIEALEDQVSQLKSGRVKFYFDHGLDENGLPVYRYEDEAGVFVDGFLGKKDGEETVYGTIKLKKLERNERLVDDIQNGFAVTFSIGFRVLDYEEIYEDNEVVGWKIIDTDLMEASAVGIPANPTAVVKASAIAEALDEQGFSFTEEGLNKFKQSIKMLGDKMSDIEDEGEGQNPSEDKETQENKTQKKQEEQEAQEEETGQKVDQEDNCDDDEDEEENSFELQNEIEGMKSSIQGLDKKLDKVLDVISELQENSEEDEEDEEDKEESNSSPKGKRIQSVNDDEDNSDEGKTNSDSNDEDLEPINGFNPYF